MKLDDAQALYDWMMERGIVRARIGNVELDMGPLARAPVSADVIAAAERAIEVKPRSGDPYEDPMLFGGSMPFEPLKTPEIK